VAWKASQPEIDIHRLVFIDETGASTKMARLYGRSPYGQRCVAALPHGHWKTTTFVGALRATGMTAPMVLDGPMDGPAFEAFHAVRSAATSGRSCSLACDVFFERDVAAIEEAPQHARRETLAMGFEQMVGDLGQRHVRRSLNQGKDLRSMNLDPS
jgi:hypothetical protein